MKKFIEDLKAKLPDRKIQFSNCISSQTSSVIYLEDDKNIGKTVFVAKDKTEEYYTEKCFKIENTNQNEIVLWSVDGCFVGVGKKLSETYPKKCDCIFGFENYIAFVEFKVNADSTAHPKTIKKNREVSIQQLEHTICFLTNVLSIKKFSEFTGYIFEAFLCTPHTYPNKNTAISDLAIAFLEKYDIELFEKNEKEC